MLKTQGKGIKTIINWNLRVLNSLKVKLMLLSTQIKMKMKSMMKTFWIYKLMIRIQLAEVTKWGIKIRSRIIRKPEGRVRSWPMNPIHRLV